MGHPKITVIIPGFNHGKYLREAVESVETAGYKEYELIIIDDGSTDQESVKVAQELKNEGYNVILQNNQGVAATRNNAIRLAKGEFIIPLDMDNRLLAPYFFEGLQILLDNPEIGVVYGDAKVIGEKSGTWVNHPMQLEEMLFENYIDTCTIIRKKMWEEVGGYDSKAPVPTRQDWIFWLDCINAGWKFHHLNMFCFEYRYLETSEVRKYFKALKKRLLITEYIYFKQENLIQKFTRNGEISPAKANEMLGKLRMQLAYYHLGFGSILKGYSFLFGSFIGGNSLIKIIKTGLGWPIRRLKTTE